MWLKVLLIFGLVFYILFKMGGFMMRMIFGNAVRSAAQRQTQQYRKAHSAAKPAEGNVDIDYIPPGENEKKPPNNFKGGDYIDFEEVKE